MAAYAAVVSLMNVIDQIQSHPHPPISFDKKQVESLIAHITFLQHLLENYSIDDTLEGRIANAAYAAEDVIELHLVKKIHPAPSSPRTSSTVNFERRIEFPLSCCFEFVTSLIPKCHTALNPRNVQTGEQEEVRKWEEEIRGTGAREHALQDLETINFERRLEEVLQGFETIKREVENVKVKHGIHHRLRGSTIYSGSAKSHPMRLNTMVGLDKAKIDILDKLTGGSCPRQTISIVGMGGIGKTTLAKNVYLDSFVKDRFDVRAWATVSQQYSSKEILIELLACQKENGSKDSMSSMSADELGNILHKSLFGRRYLVVLDDIWSVEAWNDVKHYFPKDSDYESRVMITTRLSNLASEITSTLSHVMGFLDNDTSWDLLCRTVFDGEPCPNELEVIGKEIAQSCKGLPLSIVVIGGLLAKSKPTRECWQHIAWNLNSTVMSEDDERCSRVLQMSYDQLPVYLKPCFLYMGVYPEDGDIPVPELMRLWVAEGFLKPIANKSLEQAAQEYFNELIERNLVSTNQSGYGMKIKYCKIHDLLMDLCVRETQKHGFLFVASRLYNHYTPQTISNPRRVVIPEDTSLRAVNIVKRFAPLVRSITCKAKSLEDAVNFRLIRVWNGHDNCLIYDGNSLVSNPDLVNCRYIDSNNIPWPDTQIPLFWNLQTLIAKYGDVFVEPFQISRTLQLRHVKVRSFHLPDPDETNVVLKNLQKLSAVVNLNCTEGFVERIPNIKKLGLVYDEGAHDWPSYCLNNIRCFEKLESLSLEFSSPTSWSRDYLSENLAFPVSVRKLTLEGMGLSWEDMARKIGCLPNLEVLKLRKDAFAGPEWETREGQFHSLKFLMVESCTDLERWKVESSHFPCLEQVVLQDLISLKELPCEIGDIMTLRSIELVCCSYEAAVCARNIIDEQQELGNDDLWARVALLEINEELESLTARNFQVEQVRLCPIL